MLPVSISYALDSNDTTLQSGLEHLESKNYSLALIDWHTLLQTKKYSYSPEVYYNLGLTEYKLGEFGAAIGHLRKAQTIDPFSTKISRTLSYVEKRLAEKEFYKVQETSYYELILTKVPKTLFLFLALLLITLGVRDGMRHKKLGIDFWSFFRRYILYIIASLIPLGLLFAQSSISSRKYATLTGEFSAKIYATPNSNAIELGRIKIGDSFQILEVLDGEDKKTRWHSVATSDIPFGWISSDSFIVHRGKIDPILSSN